MAVPTSLPKEQPRSLTASAMKVEARKTETHKRLTADWQDQAFKYIYLVPELNYASRFYSRMLKKIKLFPATRKPDESLEPIKDGLPVELLDRIQDPGGGRSSILGSYGRLMFTVGEGYLLGVDLKKDTERWQFVWAKELTFEEGGAIIWKRTSTSTGTTYSKNAAVAYRMWMPAPDESGSAESPMRAVMEIAEELVLLTRAVRATSVSRMVNGMLKIPSELSFGSDVPGADDDPENNPFLRNLIDHITGAIENAGSAEAATPFFAEGAAEFLAELVWEKLHDPATDYMEKELRTEAITRCAWGLDLPPEVIKGMTEANHWTGRQITHDMWRSHGAPVAEQFCDDLCDAYLRPALKEGKYEAWKEVVIGYDDSEVVISPDRSEDADRAWDRGTIKMPDYLKLKGISLDAQADEETIQMFLALKLRNPDLLPKKYLPEGWVTDAARQQQQRGPVAAPEDERDAEEGPPPPGPAGVSRRESRKLSLEGAATIALHRCREVAGARIRSQHKKVPEVLALTDGKPNTLVASILGQERLVALGTQESMALVKGGTNLFLDYCHEQGVDETQAGALGQMIEVFAARTLYERRTPDLTSGITAQILRACEVSEAIEGEIVKGNNHALAFVEAREI